VRLVLVVALIAGCRERLDELPDHDGDGVVDIYDGCPSMYDPDVGDRDGDGVGDACDPHLTTPGDEILSYTFFDHELGDWVPDTIDSWSVAGPRATTTADADSTLARLTLETDALYPTIELQFSVDEYGPSVVRRDNELFITMSNAGNPPSCGMANRDNGEAQLNVVGGNSNFDSAGLFAVDVNLVSTFRMTFDATGTHCVANERVYSSGLYLPDGSSLHAQIIVSHLQVALHSAIVYRVNAP
jgi:hypothetical protein